METENTFKKIKVYCYEHQTTCEVKAKPQIVCTIEEHTLSNNFPHAEFWEYCCDCQTFLPTKPDIVGKVTTNCPNCDREAARRFACQNCKIAAFESDEPTRGKSYYLRGADGIEPACPGCQTVSPTGAAILHQCQAVKSDFFTTRPTCPFCLEKTTPLPAVNIVQTNAENCPQCKTSNSPTAFFCGKCKYQLRGDAPAAANLGTDINKTKLLGSLCPNCSTPVPPDSGFCGECGQAVKKAVAPPPPPPKKILSGEPTVPDFSGAADSVSNSNNFPLKAAGIVVGGFLLIAAVVGIVNSFNSPSKTTGNDGKGNSANIYNPTNSDKSFSVKGNYAFATTNVLMREGPHVRFPKTGTLFRGTRVKILDVAKRDDGADWWEVRVESSSDYGCDVNDSSRCGKDDYNDAGQGWINSKNTEFR